MKNVLRQKWHDLFSAWAVDSVVADQPFEDVCQRYAEPGRFYHTLDHIQNMLATVESLAAHACKRNAVELASA